jgi:hypothetical protein
VHIYLSSAFFFLSLSPHISLRKTPRHELRTMLKVGGWLGGRKPHGQTRSLNALDELAQSMISDYEDVECRKLTDIYSRGRNGWCGFPILVNNFVDLRRN